MDAKFLLCAWVGAGGATVIDIVFDHLADITPLNLLILPSLVQQLPLFPLNPELLAVWTLLVQVSMWTDTSSLNPSPPQILDPF